jgi:hypothetical protein
MSEAPTYRARPRRRPARLRVEGRAARVRALSGRRRAPSSASTSYGICLEPATEREGVDGCLSRAPRAGVGWLAPDEFDESSWNGCCSHCCQMCRWSSGRCQMGRPDHGFESHRPRPENPRNFSASRVVQIRFVASGLPICNHAYPSTPTGGSKRHGRQRPVALPTSRR